MSACEFKRFVPKSEWTFHPDGSRALSPPRYGAGQNGIPPGPPRAIRRCPFCGKRLRLRATYCVGGEWVSWQLPDHSVRETRGKGPRRSSRTSGRGK